MKKSPREARRHFLIPDCQNKPDIPLDHIDWVAQALVDYAPDVIVNIGDWADVPSLSMHDKAGSKRMEGARYERDIDAANEAFERLNKPMLKKQASQMRRKVRNRWTPEKHYTLGNHENRIQRALDAEPKYTGMIGKHHIHSKGWRVHEFLERVYLDGLVYSHYFQAQNSSFPIGGSIDNRLNKIGESFVQGHQQGFIYGNRVYPTGRTRHGLVAGSCYLHTEDYKGAQGNQHFRGVVVLNEVSDGNYCIMPLSLAYLCKRYTGKDLVPYMEKKYKKEDWSHLKI